MEATWCSLVRVTLHRAQVALLSHLVSKKQKDSTTLLDVSILSVILQGFGTFRRSRQAKESNQLVNLFSLTPEGRNKPCIVIAVFYSLLQTFGYTCTCGKCASWYNTVLNCCRYWRHGKRNVKGKGIKLMLYTIAYVQRERILDGYSFYRQIWAIQRLFAYQSTFSLIEVD